MADIEKKNDDDYVYDNGFHPKPVVLKPNYKFYRKSLFSKFAYSLFTFMTKVALFIPNRLTGYRVYGKKNLRKNKKGNIIISNHVLPIDGILALTSIFPVHSYTTTLQSNMGFGIVSWYFRVGGVVPIPTDLRMLKKFNEETNKALQNDNVLFYPEAHLYPYCDHIREFKPGAFHYAYSSNCKIIPCVFTYNKPKGLVKLFRRKKPCVHFHILEPYTFQDMGSKPDTIKKMTQDVHDIIEDYFNKHSDYVKESVK